MTNQNPVLAKELTEQVQKNALIKDLKLSKTATKALIDSVFEAIGANFVEGRTTKVTGFGNFEARPVKATKRANPADRTQVVQRAAHKSPKFTASRGLKDLMYDATKED